MKRLHLRWVYATFAAFLLYAGVLVWQTVEARLELRDSALNALRVDADKRAAAMSYFFAERFNDLADLANAPSVAAAAHARASSLDGQNSVGETPEQAEAALSRVRALKSLGGRRIYARLTLTRPSGEVIAYAPRDVAADSYAHVALPNEPVAQAIELDRGANEVVMNSPVRFRGEVVGFVVARFPADLLARQFERVADAAETVETVVSADGRPIDAHPDALRVPVTLVEKLAEGKVSRLTATIGSHVDEPFALVKSPIDGTPFFLVSAATERALFERLTPLMVVLFYAVAPLFAFGVLFYMTRQQRLTAALRSRYLETGRRHDELRGRYSALEEEVQRREQVEHELRVQGTALEARTVELQQAMERAHRLAMYDPVTGLANRVLFREALRNALARAERDGHPLAVLFLDLDRFKRINDTLGHSAGDQLLREVATRLQGCIRGADMVGRVDHVEPTTWVARQGGDEFTVLVPDLLRAEHAAAVAKRIIEALSQPIALDGFDVVCTVSVGIGVYPQDGADVDALMKNADAAMYSAKEAGRNQYQFYEQKLHENALLRLALENDMRRGLDASEFDVHFQPLVEAGTRRIASLEALARWRHPTRGMVSPGDFIPVAEESGLIVPLTQRVLHLVCSRIAAWRSDHGVDVKVAINLSGRTLQLADVGEMIRTALLMHGVPAHLLEIELTETVLMEGQHEARMLIDQLKNIGVTISIDDFGTGYSSLAYLRAFEIDSLKIDRSFVRDLSADENSETIVRAILAMAHSLGLHVVAEGVETEAQWEFLHEIGCDVLQGFLFGRPVPAAEIAARLVGEPVLPTGGNVKPLHALPPSNAAQG